jgi:23S rRNA pseudouridine1911/1915/1917 synthase
VNGKTITKNLKIAHKDTIEVLIQVEKLELQAQNLPLDIVYQDENIAIINKDA